jgi:hypothetical protein
MYGKNLIAGAFVASLVATAYALPVAAQETQQQSATRQVDRRYNITFEPRACQRASRSRVNCEVLVTNFTDSHRQISFGARYEGYQTRLVDTEGNVYLTDSLQLNQFQKAKERVLIELAPGVPTRLSFSFKVPEKVNTIATLDMGYKVIGKIDTTDRISLTNIGAITSNSSQKK